MTAQMTLEELLGQLKRIPANWLDDDAGEVLKSIPRVIERIDGLALDQDLISRLLSEEPYYLDVFRLFLDISQDILANEMNARGVKGEFSSIRNKCIKDPDKIAQVLTSLGLIDAIDSHRLHKWTLQDVLWDRYGHMRGRAMTAQKRGATLEDAVESILMELKNENGIDFERGGNFVNRSAEQAKADFVIPARDVPQIIIEAKGYEATGSKLTDVLGDILKVLRIKDKDTHYFFVTDGIGWYRRTSDLSKIVEHHNRGEIEMIYTISTLPELKDRIKSIIEPQ